MTEREKCSVPGCTAPWRTKGMCGMHYQRVHRHGDPNVVKISTDREALTYLQNVVIPYLGDDCLTWPYIKSGAGYAQVHDMNNRLVMATRLVCEAIHGPPPKGRYHAAHSCGKGHLACISPKHLSWKTVAGNMADKVMHGTQWRGETSPLAKVSERDVIEIRALKGYLTGAEIGQIYGIAASSVYGIHNRHAWRHL